MAIYEHDPLSIWELALRWNNLDPDVESAIGLPPGCKDLLRDLCLAGGRYINPLDAYGDEYLGVFIPVINLDIASKVLRALETVATTRTFERELLDTVYFRKDQVARWCINTNRPFPFFWCRGDEADYYLGEWRRQRREEYPFEIPWLATTKPAVKPLADVPQKTRPTTQVQRDKALVQLAAKALWMLFPTMTIADLIQRTEIRIDSNGKQYKPKTLRLWVSAVDVRTSAQKTGRPKKKQ